MPLNQTKPNQENIFQIICECDLNKLYPKTHRNIFFYLSKNYNTFYKETHFHVSIQYRIIIHFRNS